MNHINYKIWKQIGQFLDDFANKKYKDVYIIFCDALIVLLGIQPKGTVQKMEEDTTWQRC